MRLTGYPIVFGRRSVDLGGFVEEIAPSAVDRTLRQRADVVALVNHDSNMPLGRTGAGTLRLAKDAQGLNVDLTVDEAITFANDLIRVIRRGDAVGGSFSFVTIDDTWSIEDGMPFRRVLDMSIREISLAVPFPAYPATSLSVRGADAAPRGVSVDLARNQLRQVLAR